MTTENINLFQMIFTGIAAIAAIVAAILAYRIGKKQIEITNFVEIFLMPQAIVNEDKLITSWKVLVKNVSSYPVYLNSYNLNGIKEDIGSTPIPNNTDSWYGIPITKDVQENGRLSLVIKFEDYLGRKYEAEGFGKYEGNGWNIHQKKRIEV